MLIVICVLFSLSVGSMQGKDGNNWYENNSSGVHVGS